MSGFPMGAVPDLMPATCPVGSDNDLLICFSHRGEQTLFANLHTDGIVLFFIPKTSGHSATARRDDGRFIVFGKIQDIKGIFDVGHGFLMTVLMNFYSPF